MKFPAWASEEIAEFYLRFEEDYRPFERDGVVLAGFTAEQFEQLVVRLMTDEDVKPVWDAWRSVGTEKVDIDGDSYIPRDSVLFLHILVGLQLFHESMRISQDDIENLQEREKHAKALARAIDKNRALERMLLNNIAIGARRSLEEKLDEKKVLSRFNYASYPGAKRAQVNHFVRFMSKTFEHKFGGPRASLLARLARVVFDDPDIDENFVKSSLTEWKRKRAQV